MFVRMLEWPLAVSPATANQVFLRRVPATCVQIPVGVPAQSDVSIDSQRRSWESHGLLLCRDVGVLDDARVGGQLPRDEFSEAAAVGSR